MRKLPATHSCFVCGRRNPIGLKLEFETDDVIVQTRFRLRPEHSGFRQTIHGGILSTVLDEVMVWACGVQARRFAYCAELNVRFVLPAKPGEELLARGELTANRRNRLFETRGEICDASGRTLASASGKYIPVPEELTQELFADFAEDPAGIWQ